MSQSLRIVLVNTELHPAAIVWAYVPPSSAVSNKHKATTIAVVAP